MDAGDSLRTEGGVRSPSGCVPVLDEDGHFLRERRGSRSFSETSNRLGTGSDNRKSVKGKFFRTPCTPDLLYSLRSNLRVQGLSLSLSRVPTALSKDSGGRNRRHGQEDRGQNRVGQSPLVVTRDGTTQGCCHGYDRYPGCQVKSRL